MLQNCPSNNVATFFNTSKKNIRRVAQTITAKDRSRGGRPTKTADVDNRQMDWLILETFKLASETETDI